jgi:menaquinone-dependent protoporphyrinogen IX oxidase
MKNQLRKYPKDNRIKSYSVSVLAQSNFTREETKSALQTTISQETWMKAKNGTLIGNRKQRKKKYSDDSIKLVVDWIYKHTSGNLFLFYITSNFSNI